MDKKSGNYTTVLQTVVLLPYFSPTYKHVHDWHRKVSRYASDSNTKFVLQTYDKLHYVIDAIARSDVDLVILDDPSPAPSVTPSSTSDDTK